MEQQQNTPEQNERNALRILTLATEQYLKTSDELTRSFVAPQAQAAVEILVSALNARWGAPVEVIPVETETAEAKVTKRGK